MVFKKALILSGLVGVLLVGCSKGKPKNVTSPDSEFGSVSLLVSFPASSPFKTIAKTVELTISASDMNTMVKSLAVRDSTMEDQIKGIPSGKNRSFKLKVYDSSSVVRYEGSATGNVVADSTTSILMTINRLVGSAIITGTVNEFPSWSVFDGFEAATLDTKWKPYSASVGTLTTSKFHTGAKSFQVTYSDFKYTFDKSLTDGKISWWYYDNSGTPTSYFYVLTDTSKADLSADNLYMTTQNGSKYYFQKQASNITTITRTTGWRQFTATISSGTVVVAVDGVTGFTVTGSSPIIAFQVAGAIIDDFSVESYSN